MSMRSWTETGWGVTRDDLCPLTTKAIAFMKKYLPEEYNEMMADAETADNGISPDMSNTEDYVDFCEAWIEKYEDDNCNDGFPALFAKAINDNEKDFDVEYCRGEDEGAVIYLDRLPWEMSDRVKGMKAEDMTAVFRKYLDEAGLSNVDIDRQSVEFYG